VRRRRQLLNARGATPRGELLPPFMTSPPRAKRTVRVLASANELDAERSTAAPDDFARPISQSIGSESEIESTLHIGRRIDDKLRAAFRNVPNKTLTSERSSERDPRRMISTPSNLPLYIRSFHFERLFARSVKKNHLDVVCTASRRSSRVPSRSPALQAALGYLLTKRQSESW
jgi:hypothetical protein